MPTDRVEDNQRKLTQRSVEQLCSMTDPYGTTGERTYNTRTAHTV